MGIELVKIRATITVGDLIVKTPYIQSFSVKKTRGQISTFDASLKVDQADINNSNTIGTVTIEAGELGNEIKIFTGITKRVSVSPCWDDPGYVLFSISGTDILGSLDGKKYTRRVKETRKSWVGINSVVREGLRDGSLDYTVEAVAAESGKSQKSQDTNIGAAPNAAGSAIPGSPGYPSIIMNINRVTAAATEDPKL